MLTEGDADCDGKEMMTSAGGMAVISALNRPGSCRQQRSKGEGKGVTM